MNKTFEKLTSYFLHLPSTKDYLPPVGDPDAGNDAKVKSFKMLAHFGLFCVHPFMKASIGINYVDPELGTRLIKA